VRQFSADDLVRIAAALKIPLGALFLPPADNGTAVRYVLDPPLPGERTSELTGLLRYAFPDFGEEYGSSPVLDAYRQRLIAAGLGRLDKSMDMALHILAEAQRVAGATIDAAQRESDETIISARQEAERVLRAAHEQSEPPTGEAGQGSDSREQEWQGNSLDEALELDAQERHRQAMGSLVMQREELQRRIDDLRAFEREYRTRLQRVIEAGYRELWSGVGGVDADDMLRELQARGERLGTGKFSAVVFSEYGTYDSFTSDDLSQVESAPGSDGGADKGSTTTEESAHVDGDAPEGEGWRP
jgi:hypothetical protein